MMGVETLMGVNLSVSKHLYP